MTNVLPIRPTASGIPALPAELIPTGCRIKCDDNGDGTSTVRGPDTTPTTVGTGAAHVSAVAASRVRGGADEATRREWSAALTEGDFADLTKG